MATAILTAHRLREVLDYAPDTGVFIRKVRLAQRHQAGDRADFAISTGPMTGYRRVGLFGARHLAHRLAWFYVHGDWPINEIDHINGDCSDNRLANLRDVVTRVNAENKRKLRTDNKSGATGVYWHKQNGVWCARINVHGKNIHLGLFKTVEEAAAVHLAAKRKLHEGCTV